MDLLYKVLQAFLGGERPRTGWDFAIVGCICLTALVMKILHMRHHAGWARAVTGANSEQLAVLAGRKVKPPGIGATMILLFIGLAGLARLSAPPTVADAPTDKTCEKDSQCETGQRCRKGHCIAVAQRPHPPNALTDQAWAGRDVPPWEDGEVEAFAARPPIRDLPAAPYYSIDWRP